eukprot:756355-Hanusia_phi.AAC.4
MGWRGCGRKLKNSAREGRGAWYRGLEARGKEIEPTPGDTPPGQPVTVSPRARPSDSAADWQGRSGTLSSSGNFAEPRSRAISTIRYRTAVTPGRSGARESDSAAESAPRGSPGVRSDLQVASCSVPYGTGRGLAQQWSAATCLNPAGARRFRLRLVTAARSRAAHPWHGCPGMHDGRAAWASCRTAVPERPGAWQCSGGGRESRRVRPDRRSLSPGPGPGSARPP